MDDRTQHGYPQPGHADSRGHEQPNAAPWPSFQQPATGAPISGRAPFPGPNAPAPGHHAAPQQPQQPFQQQYQQPMHQAAPQQHAPAQAMQYQYATGFVMPGAAGPDAQPMSAHGGTIGMPMQQGHPDAMPMLHGGHAMHAPQQPVAPQQHLQYQQPMQPQHAPMHHGATAMDPYAQPQAWAYQTPNGLQLVQPGAQPAPGVAGTAALPRRARRMKWETIVPGAAVVCLVAAIGLFISDFDRITGRDSIAAQKPASSKVVDDTDAATTSTGGTAEDADAVLAEATTLFKQGRFEDAANLVHPMLDVPSPDARLVALHDRIDAAGTRNDALLARAQQQRRAKQWPAVLVTIRQLELLRPLSPSLIKLRAQARRAIAAGSAKPKQAAPSATVAGGGHAGHAGHHPAPAGGTTSASTTKQPPVSSPTQPATIPPRPDANPVSGGGGGIGTAPTGSNCHTHGGVTECH
jgi:hypothetical protein